MVLFFYVSRYIFELDGYYSRWRVFINGNFRRTTTAFIIWNKRYDKIFYYYIPFEYLIGIESSYEDAGFVAAGVGNRENENVARLTHLILLAVGPVVEVHHKSRRHGELIENLSCSRSNSNLNIINVDR